MDEVRLARFAKQLRLEAEAKALPRKVAVVRDAFTTRLNFHLSRWIARAGVPKPPGKVAPRLPPHLRTGLWQGVALSVVQQLLGHADLKTTSVYLRMTAVELTEGARAVEVRDTCVPIPRPPAN